MLSSRLGAFAMMLVLSQSQPSKRVASADNAALEGVVHCSSDQPKVVYLETEGSARPEPPSQPVVMDQRGLRFIPHVLPVVVGTRVSFLNSDPLQHNVFSASSAKPFNLGSYPLGVSRSVTFDRPGVVEILCNVHPEMGAYIVVLETPYFTLTDEQGRYRMEGLPLGVHSAWVWCEVHGKRSRTIQLKSSANRLDFERITR